MSLPRRLAGSLAVASALVASAVADEIVLTPGSAIKAPGGRIVGTIQAETPGSVKIQAETGGVQEVPIDQIASISYTGQPATLQLAQSREAAGDLTGALEQYRVAATEAASKPLIAQSIQFARARVLAELAESDPQRAPEAIQQLEAFLKAHPRGRHVGPALEAVARLSLSQDRPDRAEQALAQLAALPWAAPRAAALKARILTKKGQHAEALKELDALIAATPKDSPRAIEARLARAEALAAAGQFAQAEAAAREVIQELPPEGAEFQAHAHNALGDCLRAAGKTKDALFAYLQTEILYDQDKEQHALALFRIAQLWRDLNREDRSAEAMARLRQLYPNSPYLKAAPKP